MVKWNDFSIKQKIKKHCLILYDDIIMLLLFLQIGLLIDQEETVYF